MTEPKRKQDNKGRFIPKGVIQSDEVIDEHNLEVVSHSSLYSKDVDAGTKIGMIVKGLTDDIEYIGAPIQFRNTEQVRDTTLRYLRSCERTGAIPSKIGLARACGCSRRAFEKFMVKNPEHPTTAFLELVVDAFSEALSQASLNGSVQPIVSIFLQKALYGMRENEQIKQPAENPLGEVTDTMELVKKYGEMMPGD